MRHALFAALALAVAAPAAAQTGADPAPIPSSGPPRPVEPGTPAGAVVVPGGTANGGPGANATVAPAGTGAATFTTDSAVGGNAGQPERALPQAGGGGGTEGGGG